MAVLKDLIVHGNSRFVNNAQFNTINAESIGAEEGIFNKLIATTLDAKTATVNDLTATNATVVGLLDVQGEMHTRSWSNSNIATIDGSFYITPTSVSVDGSDVSASGYTPTGTLTYSNNNYTKMTIAGTFDTSQLTLDNSTDSIDWPANSYVIVTGEVSVGKEWYPLGTIRGKLESSIASGSGATAKSISIIPIGTQIISGEVGTNSLTDGNGHKPAALEAIRTAVNQTSGASLNNLKLRKVKISMTSRANANDQYALGIYMTAMGSNKKTFLDIYGGNEKNGVDTSNAIGSTTYYSGALAKPKVRIGNLLGLPPVGGINPTGWGIYTVDGFFEGTIAARQGRIGGFTIGQTNLYNGALGTANSVWVSTGSSSDSNIGGSSGSNTWAFTASDRFGVTTEGTLYANNAVIDGNINATSLVIDDNVIIHSENNPNNGIKLGNQIELIHNGTPNVIINENGLTIKSSDGTSTLAQYGTNTIIGDPQGIHMEFAPEGIAAYSTETNRIWYTDEGQLVIPRVVVVDSMQAGNWLWDAASNAQHLTLRYSATEA